MSGWEPFLEKSILGVGLRHGAILSHNGETLVSSPDFRVNRDQARKLLHAVQGDGSTLKEVLKGGFSVAGVKYTVVRVETDDHSDLRYVIGRCKVYGEPALGIIVCRTYQSIIFAVHDPTHTAKLSFGRANLAITVLAETLMAQNY